MGLSELLGQISGAGAIDVSDKLLFNSVIGFRGIVEGVGCSTIVSEVAHAFSERTRKRVCVVDTSILYPTQYSLLCKPFSSDVKDTLKDWFSTAVTLPERVIDTDVPRISLLGCYNRRITDAFSSVDSAKLVDDTFDVLKDLFDVILVDLSHEWSQIAMCSAVKCNKIFTVVDTSSRCLNNITQSLNNFAISAIPFGKFRNCIVNKYSPRGFLGIDGILAKSKMNTVAVIPFSSAIYEANTLGKACWDTPSRDYGIEELNKATDTILRGIVNETPLEIIDMAEYEEFEQAVENSDIKNKAKARKIEKRKRDALLQPHTDEQKAEIKEKRHARNKKVADKQNSAAMTAEEAEAFQNIGNQPAFGGEDELNDTDAREIDLFGDSDNNNGGDGI